MFAQERQDCIVEKVNQEGSVRVKDLSIEFDVTDDCIRKDLAILEKKGLLKKAYGGAVRMKENPHLYRSADRKSFPNDERIIIAQKSISLLQPQDTIFLDISLASVEIAKQLQNSEMKLTVMTNMIEILNLLCQCSHISLVFIGGQLNDEGDGFWGSYSSQMVRSFKIDKAFLGVVGIDSVLGQISTYYIDDGTMKKTIIEQSQKSYLLCEERKFKEYGNYVFGSLNDINGLIVSKDLNQKLKLTLETYGLSII
ncbi:DeoR/GlpR family DNA-binding transcription regulator [Candidatus Stoquefichus massiliensis]|uniref:DeoR/GlpR family DNA-binding transcription regulator n=1 Tax=Candidatus Stoquefichus massiliensis TaxID=1470350 RepID=UPI0004852F80|nr:DeoR/GlpR family DNA-binding transcription regulator [Candidatus Stoquefichus massiliensis]